MTIDLNHFTDLINGVKNHIISNGKQKNITLLNQDNVKLKFIVTKFSKMPKNNITIDCILCTKDNKIINPQGIKQTYQDLKKNNKLDIVVWRLEEFALDKL